MKHGMAFLDFAWWSCMAVAMTWAGRMKLSSDLEEGYE